MSRSWWRKAAALGGVVFAIGMVPGVPAQAAVYKPGEVQKEPVVAGRSFQPKASAAEQTGRPFAGAAPVWPGRSTVDVALASAWVRGLGFGESTQVSGLPLRVDPAGAPDGAPTSLQIQSFDRSSAVRAGVDGLLLRVSRSDGGASGQAKVTVDYNAFRYAYGGDWASRLKLQLVPECALTTPGAAGCRSTELTTTNDQVAGTATAVIPVTSRTTKQVTQHGLLEADGLTAQAVGGSLVALAAGASGAGGNYTATALAPSATWNAGGSAGDFGWSYPLRVPPSLGGPTPSITLGYSSSSVDGRMASANNQPSWLGEGFDWSPGAIERKYNSCAEDMGSGANNTVKTGDQCWDTDNATISFAGHAGELLKDGSNPNLWHLRNDDGTTVEHKTGASNGDNDGEWWVATTTDGMQYWFGGRTGSNATLTAPVFGNHSGEQCHATLFKDSSCMQGYKWQLDYVVDLNGNTMRYSYAKETNRYGRNLTKTDAVLYDRAGYLTKIEYGTRAGDSGSAPMQVLFTVDDRCLSGCATKDAAHWPDVPFDQECNASPCSDSQYGPSFWTTKRLSQIKTQVWGGSAYRDVEQWTFTHSFPDPTDSITAALWLDKISHSGLVGGTTTMPDVNFTGVVMPNRVDTNNDQYPAMNKFRLKTVTSESGGKLDLTYSAPDCVKGTRVPDQAHLENNVYRCYPVKWTPEGLTSPINDFFHKYVITDVVETELLGSSSRMLTHYDYVGDPAWHYTDDDGIIKAANKTWSVWRGYGTVRTTKGDAPEQTRTETRFFRGMHGDHLPSGTRNVQLPAVATGNVPAVNDEDAYSGMTREVITYNGPSGAEVVANVEEPWQSSATASRTINGVTIYARHTGTQAKHSRTTLDDGRPARTTTETTTFDSYGLPIRMEDRNDDNATGDEQCTLLDYARNTSLNLVALVSRERKFAVDCTKAQGTGLLDKDVMSDVKTSYDGLAWNAAPTKGDVTKTETMKTFNGGSPTFITQGTATFDANGRILDSFDMRGNKTTTAYTPASGGPVTSTTETSPLGWVTTTTMEPAWGLPVTSVDTNGRKVDIVYDGLGRRTSIWLPGRDKATQSATYQYVYDISKTGPSVVTSKQINGAGNYITSYKYYDNLMRERQTQVADNAGGANAVVTDTYYDSAGRVYKKHDAYLASAAPGSGLFVPSGTIPSQELSTFDGAGRNIATITQVNAPPASPGGTEKWRTTTAYGGDHTDITPPLGGTPTSTFVNASGNAVELRQYRPGFLVGDDNPAGFDRTSYTYNSKEQVSAVDDAAGNHWGYTYDLMGRQATAADPDKGSTTTSYNDYGDLVTATDGRGTTVGYTYDALGRKTSVRSGSASGPLLAEWVYDTIAKGQLSRSVRYVGTDQYAKDVLGYTVDYKPTSVRYTIPASELGVNGTYSYVYTYNQDGSVNTMRLPALGDLSLETITEGYTALGKPSTLSTSLGSTYVTGTDYTSLGELGAVHLRNNAGSLVDEVRTYETDTRRLAQIWTTKQNSPTTVADLRYNYDSRGNITKIADLTSGDNQCYAVDYLQRLKDAWTPANGDCAVSPASAVLGGPAKYWQTYTYDLTGSRTKLVDHGTVNGDKTSTYTVPTGAHALTALSTVDNSGTKNLAYTFDTGGNTLTRPAPTTGSQTLTWDTEGRLASVQDTSGTTSYVYDADGQRLLRRDPGGKTLYLPGQELRYNTGGVKTATRYYSHAGQTVATRVSGGVTWLVGDHQGTADVSISAVGQTAAVRRFKPFGELRGSTGTWPSGMDKGFVGGTGDNTGLMHLGAREYDPLIGRFISPDPFAIFNDPQQIHSYGYASQNPVTGSDPGGTCWSWAQWACDAGKKVVSTVSSGASAAWSGISSAASWAWGGISSAASWAWGGIKKAASWAWDGIKKAASATWNGIKKAAAATWNGIKKAASATWDWTKKAASKTWNWLKTDGWNGLKTAVRKTWQTVRMVVNLPLTLAVTTIAVIGGGDCGFAGQEMMVVCQNAPGWMYNRRGTTVGGVYLTGSAAPTERELAHEAKHADQWAIFQMVYGPAGIVIFPAEYFLSEWLSGGGGCNPFEKWAGLGDGHYSAC